MAEDYYLSGSFLGSSATAQFDVGLDCYDKSKAYLSTVLVATAYAPGTSWVDRFWRIGPGGDVAFAATTAYVKVWIGLQVNGATLANTACYVDNIGFGPRVQATSATLNLTHGVAVDTTSRTFNAQAYTTYAGSPITITAEEPSYLWYSYKFQGNPSTVGGNRIQFFSLDVYIDGGSEGLLYVYGFLTTAQGYSISGCVGPLRSNNILAAGSHTVDVRVYVYVAGDVMTMRYLKGSAFYTRAY
jgi:hypothetical protein